MRTFMLFLLVPLSVFSQVLLSRWSIDTTQYELMVNGIVIRNTFSSPVSGFSILSSMAQAVGTY